MDEIEMFALQNKLRKHLNEINISSKLQYYPLLIKYIGNTTQSLIFYLNEYKNPTSKFANAAFGDFLQMNNALGLITEDVEKNKDLIRLIESL